jgi:hypothetical protein
MAGLIHRALDTETFLIKRLRPLPKVVCATWYDGPGSEPQILKHSDYLKTWLAATLEDDNVELLGQFIAYDMGVISATWPDLLPLVFAKYEKGLITDVSIRQRLFDIATGRVIGDDEVKAYSLASLSELVLDERVYGKDGSGWRLRFGELIDTPLARWPKEAVDYALGDVTTPWRIWEEQEGASAFLGNQYALTYTEFCLSLMTVRGMRTDKVAVERVRAHFEQQMQDLVPVLIEAKLLAKSKNGKLTKKKKAAQALVEAACTEKGVDIPKTKSGATSTDKTAALLTGDALLLARADYTTAEKMLSTYVPILEAGVDAPITTKFSFAATGRTKSAAPRPPLIGTNEQNAPRGGGIRECYRPREGYVFVVADLAGAELHSLAQTCYDLFGYTVLGDQLNAGIDVHLFVGAQLVGIPYEEAKVLYDAGDEDIKKSRTNAKAANFGFPGGMGPKKFALVQLLQTGRFWSTKEAQELRNGWLKALPEIKEFFAHCKREAGSGSSLVMIKIPRCEWIRSVDRFPSLANSYFQSPTAAGATAGLRRVTRECFTGDGALYGCRPVKFVHDEIVLEAPVNERLHETAQALRLCMSEEFNKFCPDYPTDAEPLISTVWSKKAKPVFDTDGRLTIWRPE